MVASTILQSILFDKSIYTKKRATEWLLRHRKIEDGYSIVHSTPKMHHYRLRDPDRSKPFFSKKTKKGITFVFQRLNRSVKRRR